MDKKGVFYSVGVGPGDPGLMTLRAVETIQACDVIAVPESGGEVNLALKIASAHIGDKPVKAFSMPMTRDKAVLKENHNKAADEIIEILETGESVAFLTLGDPTIYSTALYVHNLIAERGYEARIIPGVASFSAAAAALNMPLCMGAEPLHIIPASYGGEFIGLTGTKVLMKSGKALAGIIGRVKELDGVKYYAVNRASMEDERILTEAEAESGSADYFTVVVVKQEI